MKLDDLRLILPKDEETVSALRQRLKECAEGIEGCKKKLKERKPYLHPESIINHCRQSPDYIRLAFLSELFQEEEIDPKDFSLKLAKEISRDTEHFFNLRSFKKNYKIAYELIIRDYCNNEGIIALEKKG